MEAEGEQWRPGLNERGKWRRVEFGDLYEKELEGQRGGRREGEGSE